MYKKSNSEIWLRIQTCKVPPTKYNKLVKFTKGKAVIVLKIIKL